MVVVTSKDVVPASSQVRILDNVITGGHATSLTALYLLQINYSSNYALSTMEMEAADNLTHFKENTGTIVPEVLDTIS